MASDGVASDGDTPRARRTLDTGRFESFSDGVFAFAATLLVEAIALHPPGTALEQVLHAWPSYLAYVVSFLTIGAAWLAHSQMTERLARADPLLLRINLLLLLMVAFLPFPTHLVAEALHRESSERVFVTLYGLVLLAIRMLGSPWTPMPDTSTSTHPRMRGKRSRTHRENCCPSSAGM